MEFKERLKKLRKENHLTQTELSEKCHVTLRTIQNYEMGTRRPQSVETVQKLADALNTTPEYLMKGSAAYVLDAQLRGGAAAAKEVEALVSQVSGLFAGGELSEDALDGAMRALTKAYWIAKDNNKKYTPKQYLADDSGEEN